MADEIERQGGLKDSYTKQELLFMLFPKEINDLIDRGALIGPHVEKQEPAIENGGSPQNVVERRKILQRAIATYFDGANPGPSAV